MVNEQANRIVDVLIKSLKIIPNEKGDVMHMLRSDSDMFTQFGEIYFSYISPGFIKAWKKHQKQTQCFSVPVGNIKLVMFDDRRDSSSKGQVQEVFFGVDNYQLVKIPPEIWYGFQAVGNEKAMIVNCTDVPHDSNESIQKDIKDKIIPYSWD